ncbi:hypothetical protein IJ182_03305, partial [bacterium]|nr:hypothetical protein [bacterium]
MNINELIQGFTSYLDELSKISNKEYNTQAPNMSIFMYSSEFKQYLQNEMGADASISSMSVSDLISMDFKDGKFVKKDENNTDNNFSADENNPTGENNPTDANNANVGLDDIINNLFEDASVKKTVDTDGNGEISNDEKNAFLDAVKNLDNDAENVSIDDILSAAQGIQDGTFKIGNETPSETPEVSETPDATDTPQDAAAQGAGNTGSAGGSSGTGGSSGGGGGGDNYSGGNDNSTPTSSGGLDNLSLSE